MTRSPADAVLFDLDGCLVDSRVPFERSFNAALVAHGFDARHADELHALLGPPLHQSFARLVGADDLVQSCVAAYRARYAALSGAETVVFPGIEALLARLAAEMPLVVATSKPAALAEPLLEAVGLRHHFRAVVGPDLDVENEPKAVTVRAALAALPPGTTPVMVGDRRFDIAAAAANGIAAIGVLWGIGSERELREAGAETLVSSPEELLDLLVA